MPSTHHTGTRVRPEDLKRLQKLSKQTGLAQTEIIKRALDQFDPIAAIGGVTSVPIGSTLSSSDPVDSLLTLLTHAAASGSGRRAEDKHPVPVHPRR